jgi:NAD(P)-dependent dehydrogenase (short-subunit alcohol dehydrogenase family)
MMQETHDQLGGPHILLNLVGGYAAGDTVTDTSEAIWEKMMALNLKSVFLCCKHALKYMIPEDYGRVVNVSSKVAVDLPAESAAYAVSKAGVISLTKCLAQELKGTGVSVAAIMPSIIDTPVTRSVRPDADFSKWVKPEDIAEVLVYLSSEQGRALNGAVVPIFGGV